MARAVRNKDGSLSVEPEYPGEDVTPMSVCTNAIAQYYLDAAKVNQRLAKVVKETHGSAREQATAEIRAEGAMKNAKRWIDRMRPGRGRGGRETRG